MNLYFCDLCNESIPQADLDLGRAVRRNERLICAACEAAMTAAPVRPPGAGEPPPPVAARPPSTASAPASPVAAVALAIACVALLVGAGAGAYLFWRLDENGRALRAQIADVEHAAPAHARTVSAALAEETSARESDLAQARAELQALAGRVQELEQAGEERAALERRIDKLDGRISALGDLASKVEHQAGAVEQLSVTVAEIAAARASEPAAPPSDGDGAPSAFVAAAPGAATPVALAPAPGVAPWQGWLTDLASTDSGTRWQAVQALGDTHDPAVVPHLVPVLKDADIFVRMAACRHLGDLGVVEAIPALIDTLEDEEALVREAALTALNRLSGQSIPFDPYARDGDRSKRVRSWRDWWEEASKELLGGAKDAGKTKSKS